ncbi:MAG: hypothetical protein IPK82_21795 [Polyangiaceae bacterium]|nr:hypothetical protein [Polyangiaceae bacterium]
MKTNRQIRRVLFGSLFLSSTLLFGCATGNTDEPVGANEEPAQNPAVSQEMVRPSGAYRPRQVDVDNPVETPITVSIPKLTAALAEKRVLETLNAPNGEQYSHPGVAAMTVNTVESFMGEETRTRTKDEKGVLVGTTDNYEYRLDNALQTLEVRSHEQLFDSHPEDPNVTLETIRSTALRDLETLGVSNTPGLNLRVTHLMRRTYGENVNEKVAYKVIVSLSVGGIEVEGPRAVLSYFMDGSLHKASLRWPTMSFSGHVTQLDSNKVLSRIHDEIKTHPLSGIQGPLSAVPTLVVDNGTLRQAVIVRGRLHGATGDSFISELIVAL